MSYAHLELEIIRWAEDRNIIQKSNCRAQAQKTLEECHELIEAVESGNKREMMLEAGDVLVTLIVMSATADFDLTEALAMTYDKIKHRTGHVDENGMFVKS